MKPSISSHIGILLTNIGSPSQPDPSAVRAYLKQFLSDPRVVKCPPLLWWPILHGFILPWRAQRSAKLYQQIWTDQGSPLLYHSKKIAAKLTQQLQVPVEIGMHYGDPSIASALEKLADKKIIVLPLFPHYSMTTTATSFDQVMETFKKKTDLPEISFINHYAEEENYIEALCHSIKNFSIQHLLFSFHGLPERYIKKGDPYFSQCQRTTQLVVEKLKLSPDQWTIGFQSRLGKMKWLQPYTDHLLQKFPHQGIRNLHVICPGFAVDCLETLEEIAIRGKRLFLQSGGDSFQYIPALNDEEHHIQLLKSLIQKYL